MLEAGPVKKARSYWLAAMASFQWRAIMLSALGMMGALGLTPVTTGVAWPSVPSQTQVSVCPGIDGLKFLCGITNAEDLVVVPGTHWIVASGLGTRDGVGPPGGLRIIDGDSLRWWQAYPTWRQWYPSDPANAAWDHAAFPNCSGRPDPLTLVAHGIGVRRLSGRTFMIYMVNHQKTERIDAFKVDVGAAGPGLTWVGCAEVPAPYVTNSVAAAPDGTIFATVFRDPGKSLEEVRRGDITGALYQWTPGTPTFVRLPPGLSGPNGLEISPDGQTLYVSEFGKKRIVAFDRRDLSKPKGIAQLAGFWPDNVHWDDRGRLIAAGMNHNYDSCVDVAATGATPTPDCVRTYAVAAIDPSTFQHAQLATGRTHPQFSNVSSGLVVGHRLWLGAYRADRIAYRDLTAKPPAQSRKRPRSSKRLP
jgi:hypothetical protein